MRGWAYVTAALGTVAAVASCSAGAPQGESTSSVSQAAGVQYELPSASRVCQIIGDTDFAARPAIVSTKGRTIQNGNVIGTDLGYPIVDDAGGRILFYFGDTNFDGSGADVQGFVDSTHRPSDGCPLLQFSGAYPNSNPGAVVTTVDAQPRGVFQVPQGGTMDVRTRQIYLFYTITDGPLPPGVPFGRSVLTTASADTPNALHSISTSPFNGAGLPNFYINAPIIVQATKVPGIPLPNLNPQDEVLLVYGASQPYRQGTVQLAAVRLADVADASAYRYKTYTTLAPSGWTADPAIARPIFDDEDPPCVGEMSVTYNAIFDVYMMSYVCGSPQTNLLPKGSNSGAFLRVATNAVGPWSTPTVIFDPGRDQANGIYIHAANARGVQGQAGLVRTPDDVCSVNGGATYCCSEPATRGECGPGDQYAPPQSLPLPACITAYERPPAPSYCRPLEEVENSSSGAPGCCTDATHCCDLTFTTWADEGSNGDDPFALLWGSANPGGDYAPYLIEPYSQATAFVPGTSVASNEDIYYTISTWNPYVVDIMKSNIFNNDPDDDGVPTYDLSHKAVDNCPLAYNPDQANCNLEAETAWNLNHPDRAVQVLGDACDPVPCPRANTDAVDPNIGPPPPCRSPSPYVNFECRNREVHDVIDLTTVGSSALSDPGGVARETPPSHVVNSATRGRFCERTPTSFTLHQIGTNCAEANAIADAQLRLTTPAEMDSYNNLTPWHRITLVRGFLTSDRNESLVFSFDYGGAPASMRWDYQNDNAFWHRGVNVIGDPDGLYTTCADPSFGQGGTCLSGRLWLHGDTDVGGTNPTAPDGANVGIHGTELANYYWDEQPDRTVISFSGAVGNPRHTIPQLLFRSLGDPPPGEATGPNWRVFDRGVAIPLLAVGARVLGLRQADVLEDATSSLGTSLTREVLGGTSWLDAPGPSTVGLNQPMSITMSADGTDIAGTANLVGGRALLGRQADLMAQRTYTPDRTSDSSEDFGAQVSATVPSALAVTSGNAGMGVATLSFRIESGGPDGDRDARHEDPHWNHFEHVLRGARVDCTYTGGAPIAHPTTSDDRAGGLRYNFTSCTNGAQAGDALTIQSAQLHVESGDDQAGPTGVEVGIAATEMDSSPLRLGQSMSGNSAPTPRPRTDFVATYAPTLNGVFLVGGQSRWHEQLSDAWFKPLVGAWQQVKIPEDTLGHVLDAAFAPADGRLWVIDEAPATARPVGHWSCHGKPTIRLLRIERETGATRVVASASPHGTYDMRGLRVDRDGQILLYASSKASDTHRVVRLVPNSNDFDASITTRDPRALTSPLVVDYRGYSFLEVPAANSTTPPPIERRSSLNFSPATLETWSTLLQ